MGISNRQHIIDTSNVNNILDIGNKIIITGTGGIGKSMLMKHFFFKYYTYNIIYTYIGRIKGIE